jgi:ABC-type phosphate transport system substrate-binding protein
MKLMVAAALALALALSACGGGGDSSSSTTPGPTPSQQQPINSYAGVWRSDCTVDGANASSVETWTITEIAGSTSTLNLLSNFIDYTNTTCAGTGVSGTGTAVISYSTDAVKTKTASNGATVDKIDIVAPNEPLEKAIFQLTDSNRNIRVGFQNSNQLDASGYPNNLDFNYRKQ